MHTLLGSGLPSLVLSMPINLEEIPGRRCALDTTILSSHTSNFAESTPKELQVESELFRFGQDTGTTLAVKAFSFSCNTRKKMLLYGLQLVQKSKSLQQAIQNKRLL